jgi:hypothetical protein
VFDLRGEIPTVIPISHVDGITTSQLTIDKVVERGGLTVIEWRMVGDVGVRDVSSFFRLSTNERNSLLATLTNIQKPTVKEIL